MTLAQWYEAYRDDAVARRKNGERIPQMRHNSKLAGRELAESVGVKVPKLFTGPCDIRELEPPERRSFVVKANQGCMGRGVFPMIRFQSQFKSRFDGKARTWHDWQRHWRGMTDDRIWDQVSGPWFTEEFVRSEVTFDWKAYTIGGRVQFWQQVKVGGRATARRNEFNFWTPDFVPAGHIDPRRRYNATLPAPSNPGGLVEAAERIAQAVEAPILRVDLLDGPNWPVFLEITPFPGGPMQLVPEWDARLLEALKGTI